MQQYQMLKTAIESRKDLNFRELVAEIETIRNQLDFDEESGLRFFPSQPLTREPRNLSARLVG